VSEGRKVPEENATAMRLCVRQVRIEAARGCRGQPRAETPEGDSRHSTQSACATNTAWTPG
jgi:hypothetical protein